MNQTTPNPLADLTASIERREGRQFVLRLTDGQELSVPVHQLARHVALGETVHLKFLTAKQALADRQELARLILEEILNGD